MAQNGRQAHQLPAGRHGLPREYVVQNQRERILRAVTDVVSVAGFSAMSVEDIIATAGVSRRTFYDHFSSKDDAFLAQYDVISAALLQRVAAAYDPEMPLPERGDHCLTAAMEYFCEDPACAEMCIVQSVAAGPEAMERRDNAIRALSAIIDEAAKELPKRRLPPEMTSQVVVGGIYQIMYSYILRGKLSELPELVPDMLYTLLYPYLGREDAQAAQKAAAERGARARRTAAKA